VLFVNGLPLAVLELKNAANENATIWSAFQQLQTYQAELPSLFASDGVLVVSDGVKARVGALGAGREWFKPWRTIAAVVCGMGDGVKGASHNRLRRPGHRVDNRFFYTLLLEFIALLLSE
jgi:hypothetical protein